MTNQNNEEVLELAKPYQWTGFNHHHVEGWTINTKADLLAFASAIREKDAKLIATAIQLLKDAAEPDATQEKADVAMCAQWDVDALGFIDAAQPTADAFMAEHDARVRRGILDELIARFSDDCEEYSAEAIKEWAEKRKSAKQEGEGK